MIQVFLKNRGLLSELYDDGIYRRRWYRARLSFDRPFVANALQRFDAERSDYLCSDHPVKDTPSRGRWSTNSKGTNGRAQAVDTKAFGDYAVRQDWGSENVSRGEYCCRCKRLGVVLIGRGRCGLEDLSPLFSRRYSSKKGTKKE